jgi:hypothetical protein
MRPRRLYLAGLVAAASLCALGCADAPTGEEESTERVGAREGAFSLVPGAGWERLDPDLYAGPTRADILLMSLGSSRRATIDATHVDAPLGETLDHRAPSEAGAPVRLLVDGHEAIAWCATRRAGAQVIETCTVSVLVGTRIYDFHLQSGAEGSEAARADFEEMVRSVRF